MFGLPECKAVLQVAAAIAFKRGKTRILFEHPAIHEVGVVGVPDPNIGETIKAFVVLKREFREKITEREIIEWAKEHLAGYKYPRQVEFIKSLPRTTIGKIYRKKLREMELKKQEKQLASL